MALRDVSHASVRSTQAALRFEGDGVDLYPLIVVRQPDGAVLESALQLHGTPGQFG